MSLSYKILAWLSVISACALAWLLCAGSTDLDTYSIMEEIGTAEKISEPLKSTNHSNKVPEQQSLLPPSQELASFDTADGLEMLKEEILETGSYLSIKKSQEEFQLSATDSLTNARRAKEIFLSPYVDPLEEKDVTRKVLASHFLKYSKHVTAQDCLNFMRILVDQYHFSDSIEQRRALKFDVSSVAYMCTERGGRPFQNFVESMSDLALKAQSFNAMTVYREHSQRAN